MIGSVISIVKISLKSLVIGVLLLNVSQTVAQSITPNTVCINPVDQSSDNVCPQSTMNCFVHDVWYAELLLSAGEPWPECPVPSDAVWYQKEHRAFHKNLDDHDPGDPACIRSEIDD